MADDWIMVSDVMEVSVGHWSGEVQFTKKRFPTRILMYLLDGEIRGIPRMCPHQSYDLIGSMIQDDGIRCEWHGMHISLKDKKTSYSIKREDQTFYCLETE